MLKKSLLFLALVGLTITTLFVVKHETSNPCTLLKKAVKDEVLVADVYQKVILSMMSQHVLASVKYRKEIFDVKNIDYDFGINWHQLGIPYKYATIQMSSQTDQLMFDWRSIDEIRVGFGGRYQIVYDFHSLMTRQ